MNVTRPFPFGRLKALSLPKGKARVTLRTAAPLSPWKCAIAPASQRSGWTREDG